MKEKKLWKTKFAIKALTLCLATNAWAVTNQKIEVVELSEGLNISFEDLNPAYAAMEDEYWLEEAVASAEKNNKEQADLKKQIDFEKQLIDNDAVSISLLENESDRIELVSENTMKKIERSYSGDLFSKTNELPTNIVGSKKVKRDTTGKINWVSDEKASATNVVKTKKVIKPEYPLKKEEAIAAEHVFEPKTVAKVQALSGNIELSEGLGFIYGETQLFVGWFSGDDERQGTVWIDKAEYEIKLPLLEGELVAQLIDNSGRVLGEANFDLAKLTEKNRVNEQQLTLDLKLVPVSNDFDIYVETVYSFDDYRYPVEDVSISLSFGDDVVESDRRGKAKFDTISRYSQAVLQAKKPGYLTTTMPVDGATEKLAVTMFPEPYIKALAKTINRDYEQMVSMGTIWGRIVKKGKPVIGAKVVSEAGRPFYFHKFVANELESSTGSDGLFLIPFLSEGLNFISVEYEGVAYQAKPVPVVFGSIAVVLFELEERTVVRKVISAFTEEDIKGRVQSQIFGRDKIYEAVDSKLRMQSSQGSSPTLVEMIFEEQRKFNHFTSLSSKYDEIPLISETHLQQLLKGRERDPVIFGYLREIGVQKILVNQSESSFEVIYFDDVGRITANTSQAKAFLIFGLDPGLHFLSFLFENEKRRENLVLADDSTVSIVQ